MAKRKAAKFSATKAVKANARERVGRPKPARVLENRAQKDERLEKHKTSLEQLMEKED